MLELFYWFYEYLKIFINLCFITYIYKYFFDKCNEKKVITGINKKSKKVIKSKIGLSFIYFCLTILFYYTATFKVLFTLLSVIIMSLLILGQKFNPSSLKLFEKYDSNKFIKKIWNCFYYLINLLFKLLKPFHDIIDNNLNNKSKAFNKSLSNINIGGLNLGLLSGMASQFAGSENNSNSRNCNNKINYLSKTDTQQSDLDKYVLTDTNTNTNKDKSIKNNISSSNIKSNAKIILEYKNDNINKKNIISDKHNKNLNIEKKDTIEMLEMFKKMNNIFSNDFNNINSKIDKNQNISSLIQQNNFFIDDIDDIDDIDNVVNIDNTDSKTDINVV